MNQVSQPNSREICIRPTPVGRRTLCLLTKYITVQTEDLEGSGTRGRSHGAQSTVFDGKGIMKKVFSARWILPIVGVPIENGALAIEDGRIESIGNLDAIKASHPQADGWEHNHFRNAIICPGFFNLHTHLDYSRSRFVDGESDLFSWIYRLIVSTSSWKLTGEINDFLESARYGALQAALSGTTFFVDSSYRGASAQAITELGLRGIVGLELFGFDTPTAETAWNLWKERFDLLRNGATPAVDEALADGRLVLTVAPHAPYTVCPALWRIANDWADSHGLPVLAHLGESQEECDWIASHCKRIDEFLQKSVGRSPEELECARAAVGNLGRGLTPVQYFEKNGMISKQTIAAHCMHVDDDGLEVLKNHNVALAHCPRSNARLRNGRAPIEKWLASGIKFGLGTDSFASCDDLNPLQEALFALNLHRAANPKLEFSAADAVKLITIDSARALGLEGVLGSLEKGKKADIAIFQPTDDIDWLAPRDPHNLLLRGQPKLVALFVEGNAANLFTVASDELAARLA